VFETTEEVTNSGGVAADFSVAMQAAEKGPVRAPSGTLTEIVTSVVGWNSVTNALDEERGQDVEADADLRVRREEEIRAQGSSNIDAIVNALEDVEGVIDVVGTDNEDTRSFSVVIWDGDPAEADDNDIAQAIWDNKPAGIPSEGDENGTAEDSRGDEHTVAFSRAAGVDMYFEIDLDIDTETYPLDGDDQIKEAIVAYGDSHYKIGTDVVPSALYGAIHAIDGVEAITALRLGNTASPVNTAPYPVTSVQIALADTSRIVINT
jgi:uncharacterized phage protein gp47/JayE